MTEPFAKLARERFEEWARKRGYLSNVMWEAWQAAQPTPEQYAQAARQIADESCVAYEEGRWLTTKEVEQILHATLG